MDNKKGWLVEGRHKLPLGFYVRADEDFNYLYYRHELIATFGKNACPFLIQLEAEKHLINTKGAEKNETT